MARKTTLSPEQDIAATPTENVWVQANAGTGKTSVLIQRLLRILFRSNNVNHSGILCLTYTNAAAGEMRNRILSALRAWAMASDDELSELLDGVALNRPVSASDIAHARDIFFAYIDNPDILKIKTIHGFCEEVLRRFPIEAGVSPAWTLVSDAAQRVLLQDAFAKLISSSEKNTVHSGRVADAFAHIVNRVSENYMDDLLDILSGQYKNFFQVKNIDNYRKYFIDTTRNFLELNAPILTGVAPEYMQKILDVAVLDINSSKKPAAYLVNVVNSIKQYIDTTIDFEEYKKAWLRADGGKIAHVSKKDYLCDEQDRVYLINQRNLSQIAFDDTLALFDLSAEYARVYRELKTQRNLLDFEDLILYTRRLFSNPDNMGWVLSQLNIGLGHVLVDEAQDTSPLQWDILRMLSGDFFVDGDVAENPRSLFVVGDTKQSIYGFQGADPRAFALSRADIAAHIAENMRTIREVPLVQSFRSLSAILETVDAFFDDATVVEIAGFENNAHRCFRGVGGVVEVHRLISHKDDAVGVSDYVCMIADKIKSLVESGEFLPRDIMVLVQNRNPMASPLVVELKRRGIDVAGSDRIVLPNFPAVRDLLNLARFCLDVTDDYSLCCVLKSPICRLTERDIFNVCKIKNEQKIPAFSVLESVCPDIYSRLTDIVAASKTMAPYSFFAYVLNDGHTRNSIIAALGNQVIDPIEEFMTICLSYERTQPGTLRHFLKWFITGASEIKRDMDVSSGVRIVTVHGSKGLEASVVFLIDTARTPKNEKIVPVPHATSGDLPIWLWSSGRSDAPHCTGIDVASDALMRTRIAEYYRLLYVAMTRARDRLYVYGYTPHTAAPDIAWHTQLWRVLANVPGAAVTDDEIRIEHGK